MSVAEKVKKFANEMSEAVGIDKIPNPEKVDERAKEDLKKFKESIKKL